MSNTINKPTFYLPIGWGRKLLLSLLIGLFAINSATAQSRANEGAAIQGVSIKNVQNVVQNDSLYVSFDMALQGRFLASGNALHVVPVYKSAELGKVRLPHILVNSKKRAGYYRREQALLSHEERVAHAPYEVIVRNDREIQQVSYRYAMALPCSRAGKGTLHIEQLLEDCCNVLLVDSQPIDIEVVEQVKQSNWGLFGNTVSLITPEPEEPKVLVKGVSVGITYPKGGFRVLPHFDNNKEELERIDKVLRPLLTNNEAYEVTGMAIRGYTSIEDTYVFNMRLSEQRAEHFKQYLMEKYALGHIANFTTQGMSEDWDGLAKAVEASQMDEKEEILTVIRTVDIYDGREKQLMDMKWGNPYRYMAREFFPALRRMEMEVDYTVKEYRYEENASMQEQLENGVSQRAVFDLAKGKMDADLLLVIAKYFPHDATAIINGASAALLKGDLDRAWEYLQQVEDNPMAYNNLGVYYWLKGDTSRAITYFDQAIEANADAEKAKANKEILNK